MTPTTSPSSARCGLPVSSSPRPSPFPKRADWIKEAEREVSATIARARRLLIGGVDRDSLRQASEILEEARELLLEHGLDSVAIG